MKKGLLFNTISQKEMLNEYNKILSEQESNPFFKDPLMKKVANRLKNEIDYSRGFGLKTDSIRVIFI